MAKCQRCNGKGIMTVHNVGTDENFRTECDICHGTGEVEMTNEYFLRTATTEQLAEFIIGERKGWVYADCPNGETPCMSCKDGCDIDKLVEWLKQPHQKE